VNRFLGQGRLSESGSGYGSWFLPRILVITECGILGILFLWWGMILLSPFLPHPGRLKLLLLHHLVL